MSKEIDWGQWLSPDASTTLWQQMGLVMRLSVPAILAEVSSIAMQYIDSAMVGSLGARATAAIGLVSSTTWLFGGMCVALITGFSVQIAQLIGGGRRDEVQSVLRQGLMVSLLFSVVFASVGIGISGGLPVWLGGAPDVCPDSSRYFFIYACALPAVLFRQAAGSMLQCSGDMRTPSMLNILMCALDVVFNTLFIFPSRPFSLLGLTLSLPGAGLGVAGAALGTATAEVITAALMLYCLCFRSPVLRLVKGVPWRLERRCLRTAARLSLPMALERLIMCGAQIASTRIVAPLGTVAGSAAGGSGLQLPGRDGGELLLHARIRHRLRCHHVGGPERGRGTEGPGEAVCPPERGAGRGDHDQHGDSDVPGRGLDVLPADAGPGHPGAGSLCAAH